MTNCGKFHLRHEVRNSLKSKLHVFITLRKDG